MKPTRTLIVALVAATLGVLPALAMAGSAVPARATGAAAGTTTTTACTVLLGVTVSCPSATTTTAPSATTTATSATTTGTGTGATTTATGTTGTTTTAASGTPMVTTGPPSAVTTTSAVLSGTVNLNGATLASDTLADNCYFDYAAAGATSETQIACSASPAATGTTTVTASPTGLSAGTAYTYTLYVVTGGELLGVIPGTTTGGTVETFTTPTTTAPPTVSTAAATGVGGTTATLNATVDPENWSISSCVFSYTPSGGSATTASCAGLPSGDSAQTVSAAVSGLTQGTAYTYTLAVVYDAAGPSTVTSSGSGSFSTTAATVAAPSNLASTTATLNGTVDPEGQSVTSCTFYYGTSGPTLVTRPCSTSASAITGTSPVGVNADVTGLTPKTTYVDTVVLTTAGGTAIATPGSFKTPATPAVPTARTTAATNITTTTATLHGTVDAGGVGVKGCEFEWSVDALTTTTAPGNDLALTEQCTSTPSDSGKQTVSVTLKGLAPGTRYYSRLLFATYGGYVIANTTSFTTLKSTAKPGATITGYTINRRAHSARFRFAHTGVIATRGAQCALAAVTKGKVGAAHYTRCTSGRTYTKLADRTYVFSVRAGNANGYGPAVTHRFTI